MNDEDIVAKVDDHCRGGLRRPREGTLTLLVLKEILVTLRLLERRSRPKSGI